MITFITNLITFSMYVILLNNSFWWWICLINKSTICYYKLNIRANFIYDKTFVIINNFLITIAKFICLLTHNQNRDEQHAISWQANSKKSN